MIVLLFERSGQYFNIEIEGVKITLVYRPWVLLDGRLQYLPVDPSVPRRIAMSRNKIPANFNEILKVSKEELEEYELNKHDEKALKDIVIRDCKNKGCRLVEEQ